AGRVAAAIDAGLTGDAVDLEVVDGRLVAWKPAFGGQLVAAIHARSATQMATVRVGVLPRLEPRDAVEPARETRPVTPRSRVCVLARVRDDDLDVLAEAGAVVGVGRGVDPGDYPALDALCGLLGAELGATRKVTDNGWLPRARQIGITGRSIAPRLFVSIGASGKFNHMVGVRSAGTVLAINPDPDALVFGVADVGIVADWQTAVPALVAAIAAHPDAGRS
ncbi:MAG: electron transfer flavoprotein subunit alpha/FixB family protein, partial [Actinobacteria bacterium]|nr:electron transfer flavoprotein subunit alpha/FixB family protein [Actinomycetota bacterium]